MAQGKAESFQEIASAVRGAPDAGRLKALTRFLAIGSRHAGSAEELRSVEHTNALILIYLVVSTPFMPLFAMLGAGTEAMLLVPLVIITLVTLALQARGQTLSARHILVATGNLYSLGFSVYLGPSSRLPTMLIASATNAVLVFRFSEWRHLLIHIVCLLIFSVAIFEFDARAHFPIPAPPPALTAALPEIMHFTAIITLMTTMSILSFSFNRAMRVAADARARLTKEIKLVRLLQEVAIIANGADGLSPAMKAASELIARFSSWKVGLSVDRVGALCALVQRGANSGVTVSAPPKFCRCEVCAAQSDLSVGIALPVMTGAEAIAVMTFYDAGIGDVVLSDDLRKTLDNIGRQLGNIEARRRAEARVAETNLKMIAAAKMATIGEMASGIAHEVNNPLSVIQGYLARIKKYAGMENSADQTSEAIDSINQTLLRITKIVNGLRAFARDSTRDPFEEVPVAKVLSDTLAVSSERFKNRGIDLSVPIVDQNLSIECRPTQISQVLLNLLNNAFDAVLDVSNRRVALTVAQTPSSVVFVVEDNGHGIPEAVRDKILLPFFTTKPVGRGTGLGLSISKGIIDDHGGALSFESVPGRTRFSVRLPRYLGEEELATVRP